MTAEGGDPACWADQPVAQPPGVPRPLTAAESGEVVQADVVAHLATIDGEGFPHATPIWFLWDGDAFLMTCLPGRPHVRRLRANPKAGICIDVEHAERPDGERPNRQVRATGTVEVLDDVDGAVTRAITAKYVRGEGAVAQVRARTARPRVLLRLVPATWVAVAGA